jgi:cyclase
MSIRIIPRLDIKGPNLVKGIQLEGLRVLGKPERFARYYYESGADELFYMDAVASLYGRNSLMDIIRRTSKDVFIPLTVGGGLRTVEDIRMVLRAGADKVSINTAAITRPELIREASRSFGSSTIVVSIEAMKTEDGSYEAYVDYGRQKTGLDAIEWALRAAELGAGELLVTSIGREGTGRGFDLELISRVSDSVEVPVIASGGAGDLRHIREVIGQGKTQAVCVGSMFHYHFLRSQKCSQDDFSKEGNVEFLQGSGTLRGPSRIREAPLPEVKTYLAGKGIECRVQTLSL